MTNRKIFDSGRTRTYNLLLRRQAPYPLGHRAVWFPSLMLCIYTHSILTVINFRIILSDQTHFELRKFNEPWIRRSDGPWNPVKNVNRRIGIKSMSHHCREWFSAYPLDSKRQSPTLLVVFPRDVSPSEKDKIQKRSVPLLLLHFAWCLADCPCSWWSV